MIVASNINYEEGMDYIVIVRNPFVDALYANNERDFKYLLNKIKK